MADNRANQDERNRKDRGGRAGAFVCWGAAGLLALLLLFDAFGIASRLGLAAWWLVLALGAGGLSFWRDLGGAYLAPLLGAGLWMTLASAGLLAAAKLSQGSLGQEIASGLAGRGGPALSWLAPLTMLLLGFSYLGLATGPVFRFSLPELAWPPLPLPGGNRRTEPEEERPDGPRIILDPEEPEPGPKPEPELPCSSPRATPRPSPAPEPGGDKGPRIKPREKSPSQAAGSGAAQAGRDLSLPPLDLLREAPNQQNTEATEALFANSRLLEEKLEDYNVKGEVIEVAPGPVVTMYEFKPAPGVKISKVANLADDLAMNLKAASIRIVAPIPGKAVIGIEIPSTVRETVHLRELLVSSAFQNAKSPLTIALGKDIAGKPVVEDLAKMPHLLIAGATGSGKSVFINTLVLSLLYKSSPERVRLLMVDPKRIELSVYNDIPHLLHPIITDAKAATAGLNWAVGEMERRYDLLAEMGVRNIASYNKAVVDQRRNLDPEVHQSLPWVVVIIDELSDLMMVSSKEVEAAVIRLAQMSRAAGIHLVLATQRPSVDVITGLIKANFPARISFQVSSRVDSRTILDVMGAEHLLGMGDMLFMPPGTAKLARFHGAFVSDEEIEAVTGHLKQQAAPDYDESIVRIPDEEDELALEGGELDERYDDAVALVQSTGKASISFVQRKLRVGYNRAARMIEHMERQGLVGPSDGSKPREVLVRE